MDCLEWDLLIVGSGLAGTSAAIEAAKNSGPDERICILEMEASYGGNSMKSTSGMNAALTPI
jgi:succinate dehydrogenase/fumarate reductase flavoprotein subunit